jgi:hypothetical protein
MRSLVASAGVAAAIAGFGFTSGYAGGPGVYTPYSDEVCDGYNILPYAHPLERVSSASCYAKCEAGVTGACSKDGVLVSQDSATICLDAVECGKLCWSLDECQSYDSDGDVCYLNTWDCASVITSDGLTESDGFTLYAKQVPWQAECGGKMAVDVVGGDYGVDESYEPDPDDADVFIPRTGFSN